MAAKEYSQARPESYVTLGGFSKKGEKNPSTVTGYYLGRLETDDNFNPGKKKTVFMVKTLKGIQGVNGNAGLVLKMDDTERTFTEQEGRSPLNTEITITCTGERPSKKGNPMKTFSVALDPDVVWEGAPITAESQDDDSSEDDEDAYEIEEVAQKQALSALERKAKVEALLKGKGSVRK